MQSGDYMLHVLLQTGKNFKADFGSDTIDAICQIDCFGKTCFSKVVSGCTLNNDRGQYFGEHFFIEGSSISKDQI